MIITTRFTTSKNSTLWDDAINRKLYVNKFNFALKGYLRDRIGTLLVVAYV